MNINDYLDTYKKWWLGKLVRQINRPDNFSKCVDIIVYGPPSGIRHFATLILEDDSIIYLPIIYAGKHDKYRPTKNEIEVL